MNNAPNSNDDLETNLSDYIEFGEILKTRLSRRDLLSSSIKLSTGSLLSVTGLAACGSDTPVLGNPTPTALSFKAVNKTLVDQVVVPDGYTATVLARLGDPLSAATSDYRNDGSDPAASFDKRVGDHHDGMHFFGLDAAGSATDQSIDRGLIAVNHEAITPNFLHTNGVSSTGSGAAQKRTVADEVLREMNVHGVSVFEVSRSAGQWSYKKDSSFNRRITTLTPISLSGPAAGSKFLRTAYSKEGTLTRGTINNCASGYTPWGTYLTCEENWAGYFRRIQANDDAKRSAKELVSLNRYGVRGNGRELWATVTPDTTDQLYGRWLAEVTGTSNDGSDDYRNVANTFGWTVEIDPYRPTTQAKKRTALGRFAHEGCWPSKAVAGKPLAFYMGCDSRNEYVYKFVSSANWDPSDAGKGMSVGDKYLDSGKLYVAKYNADGSGEWIELSFGVNGITPSAAIYAFENQADVCINSRLAADLVGATKMDRPEWGAVNPLNGEFYLTLTNTNSTSRAITAVDAANPRFYNDKRTTGVDQLGNPNGHIIRLAEANGETNATKFRWDVFLFGSRANAAANVNLSGLTDTNDFSSPDGLWFSQATPGLLWIQTDDGAYTDVTNCMLLAAIPGKVGDGKKFTVTNTSGSTSSSVDTYIGATMGDAKLRRFLVGPKECEITGIAETPDGKALFVNIQHPGEDTTAANFASGQFNSVWPDGSSVKSARPRSATIVITKNDGGPVGS